MGERREEFGVGGERGDMRENESEDVLGCCVACDWLLMG